MQVSLLIYRKKRVSSTSQESDTTWLGDDVLGVEVIKYDINGYSVNIKRKEEGGDYIW